LNAFPVEVLAGLAGVFDNAGKLKVIKFTVSGVGAL